MILLVGWLAQNSVVWADGGVVRFSEVRNGRRITVLTTPTPMRAGPIDVSVLVQDADSGTPLTEVPIVVHARAAHELQSRVSAPATSEAATNKLMRAATLQLSEPGWWHVDVTVDQETVGFDAEVDEALPAWLDMSLWIGWPLVAVGLFALHRWLSSSRGK